VGEDERRIRKERETREKKAVSWGEGGRSKGGAGKNEATREEKGKSEIDNKIKETEKCKGGGGRKR